MRNLAERQAGKMLAQAATTGERHDGHKNLKKGPELKPTTPSGPTLAAIGVSKDQSSKWQEVAALTDDAQARQGDGCGVPVT